MDLKNAVAVCLISLFSATLVVLIARALDLQAAARLEPQLERIAEELETIRKQGRVAALPGDYEVPEAVDGGLVVYLFHGNTRCPDCRAIESQSHEVVHSDFATQVQSGEIVWKTANYEDPADAEITSRFGVHIASVVLARMKGGQVEQWKRLDRVWPLVGDQPAFADYVRDEIDEMLASAAPPPGLPASSEVPVPPVTPALGLPIPDETSEDTALPLPVPASGD